MWGLVFIFSEWTLLKAVPFACSEEKGTPAWKSTPPPVVAIVTNISCGALVRRRSSSTILCHHQKIKIIVIIVMWWLRFDANYNSENSWQKWTEVPSKDLNDVHQLHVYLHPNPDHEVDDEQRWIWATSLLDWLLSSNDWWPSPVIHKDKDKDHTWYLSRTPRTLSVEKYFFDVEKS